MATAGAGELSLSLLTVNVNGLAAGLPGGTSKVQRLLKYMEVMAQRPDVVVLQEVKCRDVVEVRNLLRGGAGPGLPWKGKVFFNPGTGSSRGVAVLVRDGCLLSGFEAAPTWADGEGRVVRVDCRLLHLSLSICCVYAPCEAAQRAAFFEGLGTHLPEGRVVLLGGDFNCSCCGRRR